MQDACFNFMLHWQGGMSRRSVDRSLEDVIKNDELIVKACDGIRSAPTMSTIFQFIPSGSELLVALDLNTLWRDTTAKGMDGRVAMLNAFQELSTPDSAKVMPLPGPTRASSRRKQRCSQGLGEQPLS